LENLEELLESDGVFTTQNVGYTFNLLGEVYLFLVPETDREQDKCDVTIITGSTKGDLPHSIVMLG
jgi:hypothetical protein